MNKDVLMIMVVCFSVSFILLYKCYLFYKKKKDMILVEGICTDKTYRTGYSKNTYIYYYSYTYKNEEYTTNDTTRFKLPFFNIDIKDKVNLYINKKNPNNAITPLELFYSKLYLILSFFLIIVAILIK